jgi:hypothetical protein
MNIRDFLFFFLSYQIANNLKYSAEDTDSKYYSSLVFVYDVNDCVRTRTEGEKNPNIYSSINIALKGLKISHSTILDHINNKYLYKSNLILSFEPLSTWPAPSGGGGKG